MAVVIWIAVTAGLVVNASTTRETVIAPTWTLSCAEVDPSDPVAVATCEADRREQIANPPVRRTSDLLAGIAVSIVVAVVGMWITGVRPGRGAAPA
jgi:hypothetical protein